jgi:hypothetical protein
VGGVRDIERIEIKVNNEAKEKRGRLVLGIRIGLLVDVV